MLACRRSSRAGAIADWAVNAVIVLTCLLVARSIWRHDSASSDGVLPQTNVPGFRVDEPAQSIPGVSYDVATRTLILYVKSTCVYCTESMPALGRLYETAAATGTQVVAVSPEPIATTAAYFQSHQVKVHKVVSFSGGVIATPTFVLVNAAGLVEAVWLGKPDSEHERQIVQAISRGQPSARLFGPGMTEAWASGN